jgi:hypothetical protein
VQEVMESHEVELDGKTYQVQGGGAAMMCDLEMQSFGTFKTQSISLASRWSNLS